MNGQFENQSSRLMKTIEEGSIVDDDSITAYPKLSKLPKKVESNRKLDLLTIFSLFFPCLNISTLNILGISLEAGIL